MVSPSDRQTSYPEFRAMPAKVTRPPEPVMTMSSPRRTERPREPKFRIAPDDRDLPGDLKDRVDLVLRMASAVRIAEADYVYSLALLVKASTGHRLRDGSSATAACASAVGLARTTLAAFTLVAARWTADELRQILALRDVRGQPLSVTHLVLIARLPRAVREPWIARVLAEGLDVRSLKRAIRCAMSANVASDASVHYTTR